MVNFEPKQPRGIKSVNAKAALQRQPRGIKEGGRFAPGGVTSETTVDLVEGDEVGYVPDGSKAFEERSQKAREDLIDPVTEFQADAPEQKNPKVAPIKLGGSVEYDSGSWQYPPAPRSVEQLVGFWSDCLISDAAIANVENADCTGRDFFEYEKELERWDDSQPTPTTRYRKKHPEEHALYVNELRERKAIVDKVQFGVGLIPRSELRDVVRIGAAWFQSIEAGESVRDDMYRTKFLLGTGEVVTTKQVLDRYRLNDIYDAFFSRVRYSRPD
jgi:hypothetical protein